LGAAGALAGEAIAPEGGGIPGGAAGFAVGSMMQEIAPAYQRARADGLDHDAAVTRAIEQSGIAGAFGAVMGMAPGLSAFGRSAEGALRRPISEALAQVFGVQPGLGAAQQVAQGAIEGKMPTAGELATGYAENVGLGAALTAGHAAVRAAVPERAAGEPSAEPPPAMPRHRTVEEIENEDGIGPEAAQRVAAVEAVKAPAAAAASVQPAEATDDAARQRLEEASGQGTGPQEEGAMRQTGAPPEAPGSVGTAPVRTMPSADERNAPSGLQSADNGTLALPQVPYADTRLGAAAAEVATGPTARDVATPAAARPSSSWVVTDKKTNKAVFETFDPTVAAAVNTEKYNVVPIGEYLPGLNKTAYDWATGQSVPKAASPMVATPVGRPDPGESLLQFLIRRGGLQPHGDLRAMDANIARPGLVRKSTGMQLDYAREAAAEAGFLPMDSTPADLLDLVSRELKGQKQYGNHMPEQITPGTDVTGREEARREGVTEDVRMAADDAGLNISGATLDHAVELAARGMPPEQAVVEASRFADAGPNIEDIPFGRRAPLPPQSGAPLLGEPERVPRETPQREPTIRTDTRQIDMFGTRDAAVQAQAARDQAGPKSGQKAADEGLFAPKEPGQEPLFGRGPGTTPITAYHGSPHDFDRFDISKIGTGEGAQAYGHGLYFAEREGVARDYKNRLAPGGRDYVKPDAEAIAQYKDQWDALAQQVQAARGPSGMITDKAAAIQHKMDALHSKMVDETIARNPSVLSAGRLYEARLHLDPDKTLDWDAPLSQQPKGVQDAVRQLAAHGGMTGDLSRWPDMGALYKVLAGRVSPARAAKILRDAGIEGIRYLDAGSRGAGEGSRNYVVFDDKLIDIERKYGRAAEARAAGEAPHPDAVRAAIEAAQRITGNHVRIETYSADHDVFRVRFPDGKTEQVFGYTLGRLLRAAIEPERTAWNLNHEAVHALKALGVFNPGEWRTLENAARKGGWVEAEGIAKRYPGLTDAQHLEEAIAERFARWTTEPRAASPLIARLGQKIADFFQRVRNALAGRGFQTPEDVFGRMERGEVGAREPAPGAPTLPESVDAARRFEAAQGKREPIEPQFARRPPVPGETVADTLRRQMEPDSTPQKAMKNAREFADDVKRIFAPTSRGKEAKAMELTVSKHGAVEARMNAQATKTLEQEGRKVGRLSVEDQLDIWRRRELGQPQRTPALNVLMNSMRDIQSRLAQIVRSFGPEYLPRLLENYMGHRYSNHAEWKAGFDNLTPEEAFRQSRGQTTGKSPLLGSQQFLKPRHFMTLDEALNTPNPQGVILQPRFINPIEAQLHVIYEMSKFINGTRMSDEIKNNGMAHWVPFNQEGQARGLGWQKLDDNVFQPRVTGEGEYGRKEYGNWWAPEPVATVFNNYVSRGLRGRPIYDAIRSMGNALNSLQLGFSGFHATFETFEAMISKVAGGIFKAVHGSPGEGLRDIVTGFSPHNVATTIAKGHEYMKAYHNPEQATPTTRAGINALIGGGLRPNMDVMYRTTAAGSFFKNLGDLKHPGAVLYDAAQMAKNTPLMASLKIAGRVIDTINEPLMGFLVPRAKLGVAANMAEWWLRKNPDATAEETQAFMKKLTDSVDNRLGQLGYDNLFWSKTLKDIAFISMRSVGWNLGSVREIAGGVADTGKFLADAARLRRPDFTMRMAYVLAMPAITATYGAILTYLYTGQGPQELKDYFYPPTGTETVPGVKDRVSMPGYAKDTVAFKNDPLGTVGNKTQPLFETAIELAKNKDYYGGVIYAPHSDDPNINNPLTAYRNYLLNQALPFSFRGWLKSNHENAPMLTQALNFFGFQSAPQSITNPAAGEAGALRDEKKGIHARAKEAAKGRILFGAPP
jgi:hypothetical protein